MNTFDKVIFVCNGNTCRSPMAATVMANPKAVAVAAKHNMIIPNNSAKQLLNEDFGNDTLVLAMNSHMKQKIYDEYSEAINVYTLSEYAGEPEQESIWMGYQKKKKIRIKEKNNDSNRL